ncbi:unnamed protein product, partial [Choristocarpus tenellus]
VKVRLVVNSIPFRQSASHASTAGPYEAFVSTVGGHLVTDLGPGNHTIGLEWKKSVGGVVRSWSNRPSESDGHASGRSIVVTAQHRYMWHKAAKTDARISQTGLWEDVPEMTMVFTL